MKLKVHSNAAELIRNGYEPTSTVDIEMNVSTLTIEDKTIIAEIYDHSDNGDLTTHHARGWDYHGNKGQYTITPHVRIPSLRGLKEAWERMQCEIREGLEHIEAEKERTRQIKIDEENARLVRRKALIESGDIFVRNEKGQFEKI